MRNEKRKWLNLIFLIMIFGSVQAQQADQEEIESQRNSVADTPGTGAFPAIKEVDPTLPDQVVYRPADLSRLGDTKLGIYAFGNGGCTDDGASTRQHLLEVASHGYLAIAPGGIYSGPNAIQRQTPEINGIKGVATKPEQLGQAIDWALAENDREGSLYYGRVDPSLIAVSGYSCGGLQALLSAKDERVASVIIMNSGLFTEVMEDSGLFLDGMTRMGGMEVGKEALLDIHSPVLYILGGVSDIAYVPGMDDFSRINHVPVAVANIDKGHGGTYWEFNGGKAAKTTVYWLDWQLRGDEYAKQMFVGESCGLCLDLEWTINMKSFESK